jgi:hypothetical protein
MPADRTDERLERALGAFGHYVESIDGFFRIGRMLRIKPSV